MNTLPQEMIHIILTLLYINTVIEFLTRICIINTFLLLFNSMVKFSYQNEFYIDMILSNAGDGNQPLCP